MIEAKWIWIKTEYDKDDYAEFSEEFSFPANKKAVLKISCDGAYSVFLNGKAIAFSSCADYPYYKFFDKIDITEYCEKQNALKIQVWHIGVDSQTYIKDAAGVIYELEIDGKIILYSGKHTLSRKMSEYKNGYCKTITNQLGLSFLYDNTAEKPEYSESVEVGKPYDLHRRGIENLILKERQPVKAVKKQNSVLFDMEREIAGFADLEFTSPKKQKILFAYGEHINGGHVNRIIGDRDFSFEFIAKQGENKYLNAFRRIAGRYIEVFCDEPIEIKYIGIRPVVYPVSVRKTNFGDPLTQKIYDVCVDTLRLCMHEHYEDCPWREQALYTLDSRNQMLCGYYAFDGGNADYARHNLLLISKGLRKDGLLSLCFPAGIDFPIPFFSLVYISQVYEYIKHTNDVSILCEVGNTVRTIFDTFNNKIDDNGLIAAFPYPYWNFYEWAEESNNESDITRTKDDKYEKKYDLILNCAFVYAAACYEKLFGEKVSVEKTKNAVCDTFYSGSGYKLSTSTEKESQLGNSFAILIGLRNEQLAKKIVTDKQMITATLSMRTFLYDALLTFGDKYKDYIISDIKEKYKKMLDAGATSFWETEKGNEDFGGAGSLCHGWSAMPVYYFSKLLSR